MTYDTELLLLKEELPDNATTTTCMSPHNLLSIFMCSDVPGYETL